MTSLFEWLFRKPDPLELSYFNPVKAKIGTAFMLNVIGLRDKAFRLQEIWEYGRVVDGQPRTFGDYILRYENEEIRLRFIPVEAPDSILTHHVVVMRKYDEMPYNQELDNALRCGSGELEITENGQVETYWRPFLDQFGKRRATMSYTCDMKVIRDLNNDGTIEPSEIHKFKLEYWDYSRMTKDEAGQDFTQHLFVELFLDSRIQVMWRGEEVDAQRITVL